MFHSLCGDVPLHRVYLCADRERLVVFVWTLHPMIKVMGWASHTVHINVALTLFVDEGDIID